MNRQQAKLEDAYQTHLGKRPEWTWKEEHLRFHRLTHEILGLVLPYGKKMRIICIPKHKKETFFGVVIKTIPETSVVSRRVYQQQQAYKNKSTHFL